MKTDIYRIMSVESQFKEEADNFFKVVNNTLTDDELKEVYALFKQVRENDLSRRKTFF